MTARPTWLMALSTPFRACHLCDHGVNIEDARHCRCSQVVQPARTLPVHTARAPTGPCGPDARFMDFRGLNP